MRKNFLLIILTIFSFTNIKASSTTPSPTFTNVAQNCNSGDDATYVVSGLGISGATVTLFFGSSPIVLTGTVQADDTWQLTTPELSNGYNISAQQQPLTGPVSDISITSGSMSNVIPNAPTNITSSVTNLDSNCGFTNFNTYTISGDKDAGNSYTIYLNSGVIYTGAADDQTTFSASIPATSYNIDQENVWFITQTAVSPGGQSCESATAQVVSLSAPTINNVTITDCTQLTVSGTAEAGYTVTIYTNGTALPNPVTSDSNGNYTYTTNLDAGTYCITASQTDFSNYSPYGLWGNAGVPTSITVGTYPNPPTITTFSITNIQVCQDAAVNTLTVSGQATTGNTVNLYFDGDVIETTIAANGSFSFTYKVIDNVDAHGIYVTQTDANGCESIASEQEVLLPVPTFTNVEVTDCTTLTVSGNATANNSVGVYLNGTSLNTGTADTNGNYIITTTNVTPGTYCVSVNQTDGSGDISAFNVYLTVDNQTQITLGEQPAIPTITTFSMGNIVSCSDLGSLNTLNIAGNAVTGNTVSLYINNVLNQTTVATDSSYSFTYSIPDTTATYEISVTQTDANGCESVNIGTAQVLPAPTISDVTVTDCNLLTVSGTLTENNNVVIYINGVELTSGQGNNGNYSVSGNVPNPGTYCVTVAQGVGDLTVSSLAIWGGTANPTQIVIDATPSGTPTISSLIYTNATASGITNLNNWTIEGAVTVGDSISISLNGTVVTTQTPSSSPYSYSSSSPVTISQANTFKVTETTPNSGCTNSVQITTPVAPANIVVDLSQCGAFRVTGSGTANATAQIYLNGSPTTSAAIGSNGLFDTGYIDTATGSYYVTVAQVVSGQYSPYAVGNSGSPIVISTSSITAPTINNLQVLYSPVKNKITVTGTAIAGDLISLYDGTTLLNATPVTVPSTANYSVTSDNALSLSSHAITTTQYDTIQNCTSAASEEWDMAPAPVLTDAEYEGDGFITVSGYSQISGYGYLKIFANGNAISEAVPISSTFNDLPSTIPLYPGTYNITAQYSLELFRSVDTNSVFSDPALVVFIPATAPVITSIINNCDGSITINGKSDEFNSTVTIYLNSVASATGPTDSNGNFSVTTQPLAKGTYIVQAKTPNSPISEAYIVIILN